jgi:hypothetical protein
MTVGSGDWFGLFVTASCRRRVADQKPAYSISSRYRSTPSQPDSQRLSCRPFLIALRLFLH